MTTCPTLTAGVRYALTVTRPRWKDQNYTATFVRTEGGRLVFELEDGVGLRVDPAVLADEPVPVS